MTMTCCLVCLVKDGRFKIDDFAAIVGQAIPKVKSTHPHRDLANVQSDDVPSGLDRIDQESYPLDGQYTYRLDGTGVTVFVLDSGLRTSHVEFSNGLPKCGFDAIAPTGVNGTNVTKERCSDGVGHGTHVAGTVGGSISGVAKNATLVAVRILGGDGSGSLSSILAGVDYVISQKKANVNTPMVVNMSIGGFRSGQMNSAVDKMVEAGIVVVVAAGNSGRNACLASPASAKAAITVGASTYSSMLNSERRAAFSNHGRCVDIFA